MIIPRAHSLIFAKRVIEWLSCDPIYRNKEIDEAVYKCKSFQGAEYDASFDLGVKSLYCSELIYQSYQGNSLGANLEDFVGLGRPYISPTGLYHAKIWKL